MTVATNAITTRTAEYLGMAVDQFRGRGWRVDEELLAHISPAHSDNIGLSGHHHRRCRPRAPPNSGPTEVGVGPEGASQTPPRTPIGTKLRSVLPT